MAGADDRLAPLALPRDAARAVRDAAARSDFLLFGETHGTREVPRLVIGLLPKLARLGYGGLGIEMPRDERDALAAWARGRAEEPPAFFARPSADGRGNREALALVRRALRAAAGWEVLAFDMDASQPFKAWPDRDLHMARNLTEQRQRLCPNRKVVAVCGNLHSRLVNRSKPGTSFYDLWPSFASRLQQLYPGRVVSAVSVVFHSGAFFNMSVRSIHTTPLDRIEARQPDEGDHSLELHLPRATPATFLVPPAAQEG